MFYELGPLSLLSLFFLPFHHSPPLLSHLICNPFFFLIWVCGLHVGGGGDGSRHQWLLISGFDGWVAGWVLMVANRWGDGWVLIAVDQGLLALGFFLLLFFFCGGFCSVMNLCLYLMVTPVGFGRDGMVGETQTKIFWLIQTQNSGNGMQTLTKIFFGF